MAIEKAFAPSVVIPPWASSSAWNSRTTVPRSAITGGRNRIAPAPVPVGWLELPVTDGSLIALSTKVKAPAAPSSSVDSGFSRTSFTTARAPWTTNGAAAIVQPMACAGGRNPSAMCMPMLRSGRSGGGSGGLRRTGGDEPLGQRRAARPVQVQVRGVHTGIDEALGPVGRPLPGRRGAAWWIQPGAVELVAAHPRAGRRQRRVVHGDGGAVAEGQPRRHGGVRVE